MAGQDGDGDASVKKPPQAQHGEYLAWPLAIERYDRDPDLSSAEWWQLEKLIQCRDEGKRFRSFSACRDLRRLLSPIDAALSITHPGKQTRSAVISLLLQHMYHRRTAFWAWTEEDWMGFLGETGECFYQRFKPSLPRDTRPHLMAIGYLLCSLTDLHIFGNFNQRVFATKVFGAERVNTAIGRVCDTLLSWGYSRHRMTYHAPVALCEVLLANRSPSLEDLTLEILETVRRRNHLPYLKKDFVALSRALVGLGILERPLLPCTKEDGDDAPDAAAEGMSTEWFGWCQRWRRTSTLAPKTREKTYGIMLQVGRWLAQEHPHILTPGDWTRELAAEYVAAVERMSVGQWVPNHHHLPREKIGKPFSARSKDSWLAAIRMFFRDSQEWGWIPRRFDPGRCFATPRSIRALIGPDPRVIADDSWAKLLWAGLNLTYEDLPTSGLREGWLGKPIPCYPLEMMRAMVIVWLFCGLRSDEFCRLRLGCIRWQRENVVIAGTDEELPKDAVCLLDVPVNKTGTAFTKPVDPMVGEAIRAWEQVRPVQPAAVDTKTGEMVSFLFSYRGRRVGHTYINEALIPMLCRKAGIPKRDARGDITSHRARSTIATQLFNAKEPLSLFELQEWLGHRNPNTTQQYARIAPTRLARAYDKAGYFGRNIRMVEVLIDQDAIKRGTAATGEPWKFYDLGHGYCTYDFFDQCPHRMACARCSFYLPKGSSQAQLLEGKANLQRMLQEIPLTEEEQAAVEDGITAMEKLCTRLADVPTPAGPTPSQLGASGQRMMGIIPLDNVRGKRQ